MGGKARTLCNQPGEYGLPARDLLFPGLHDDIIREEFVDASTG
jgi:hypothetical protein